MQISKDSYAIGGGTVLSQLYNHRISKDIDIFIWDPQLFDRLNPRSSIVDREDVSYYHQDSIFFQVVIPTGKIDFILAGQLTDFLPQEKEILNHQVNIEHPVEIVSKKIFYRGTEANSRDIFDFAVVSDLYGKDLRNAMRSFPNRTKDFFDRVKNIHCLQSKQYSIENSKLILPGGEKYIGKERDMTINFLENFILNERLGNKPALRFNRPQKGHERE